MKIKNEELGHTFAQLSSLKDLPLEGDVVLAVIELKDSINKALNKYDEARKQLIESFCKRDEKNQPIRVETPMQGGGIYISYEFDNPENEKKCKEEMFKMDQTEADFDTPSCSMTLATIKGMKGLKEDQARALKLLMLPELTKA